MSWRCVDAYAVGTSHATTQTPCQDRCTTLVFQANDGGEVMVCVVSDGAGSAKRSEEGAQVVCDTLVASVRSALQSSSDLDAVSDEVVRSWFAEVRAKLRALAADGEADIKDYSATALLTIAAPMQTLCAQIGDGGIVLRENRTDEFTVAIWPEAAEYANETFFVTDGANAEHVQVQRFEGVTDVIAFSDGLQRLAIEQPTRSAHSRFFAPLIATVRGSDDVPKLQSELLAYLNSDAVNSRTDDDKSLAIACRLNGQSNS